MAADCINVTNCIKKTKDVKIMDTIDLVPNNKHYFEQKFDSENSMSIFSDKLDSYENVNTFNPERTIISVGRTNVIISNENSITEDIIEEKIYCIRESASNLIDVLTEKDIAVKSDKKIEQKEDVCLLENELNKKLKINGITENNIDKGKETNCKLQENISTTNDLDKNFAVINTIKDETKEIKNEERNELQSKDKKVENNEVLKIIKNKTNDEGNEKVHVVKKVKPVRRVIRPKILKNLESYNYLYDRLYDDTCPRVVSLKNTFLNCLCA